MSLHQAPIHLPPNPYGLTLRLSALCTWYLRSVNLGTYREELATSSRPLNFPADFTEEKVIRALLLVKRYREYARIKAEDKERQHGAYPPTHLAGLDRVPLLIIFYVALGLACEWTTMDVRGSQPPQHIDWGKYGFLNPRKESPRRCLCHSRVTQELPTSVEAAYPGTGVACFPEVCTWEMQTLYYKFRYAIGEACWAVTTKTTPAKLRAALIDRNYVSQLCTGYLRSCDYGNRDTLRGSVWERVQVVLGGGHTPRTYYLALALMSKYRTSLHFGPQVLIDIPLEWAFYATFLIADALVQDSPCPARTVLFSLGFPQPTEQQTGRRVCFDHSLDEEHRNIEGESYFLGCGKKRKEERRREKAAARKAETESYGHKVEVCAGPIHRMSAKEYMGCDGVLPCVEGMVRLKDYMLVHVFEWDLSLRTDEEFFTKLEQDLKKLIQ